MASTDFYIEPFMLSSHYKDALKERGHPVLVGWRSAQPREELRGRSPQGVEILTEDGSVFWVATNAKGKIDVEDITAVAGMK